MVSFDLPLLLLKHLPVFDKFSRLATMDENGPPKKMRTRSPVVQKDFFEHYQDTVSRQHDLLLQLNNLLLQHRDLMTNKESYFLALSKLQNEVTDMTQKLADRCQRTPNIPWRGGTFANEID